MNKFIAILLCCCFVVACTDDKKYAPKEGRIYVFDNPIPETTQGTSTLKQVSIQTQWPSKNFNNQNQLPNMKIEADNRFTWETRVGKSTDLGSRLLPTPVAQDNFIYVLDGTYSLTKIDENNGHVVWQKQLAENTKGVGLALQDNTLFANSSDGMITAISADGDLLWQKDLNVAVRSSIVADKKALYLITTHNQLIVLSQKNGNEIWHYQTTKPNTFLQEMAAPALSNGILVVPFSTGEVIAFDNNSGLLSWIQMMIGNRPKDLIEIPQIAAAPIIEGNTIYLTGNANLTGAYDLKTGASKWTNNYGSRITPILGENALFLLTNQNILLALDKKTGKVFWQQPFDSKDYNPWQNLFVLNDQLVLSDGAVIVFVDPSNGKTIKTQKQSIQAQPIAVNGHLVTLDKKTNLTYK